MTFCYTPWVGLSISLTGTISSCCKLNNTKFNIHTHSITDYLNSEYLRNIKQQFIAGHKPNACLRCWKDEEQNIKSKRIIDYERYHKEYNSYDLKSNKCLNITLSVNNTCNLKCRICNTTSSTKWIKEKYFYTGIKEKKLDNFLNSNLADKIKPILEHIIHLDLIGGETLIAGMEQQLAILNEIVRQGRASKVNLHYTTNGTIFPNARLLKLWKKFKNVNIQLSIDGTKQQFEYNRFPASWDECYSNIKQFQQLSKKNNNIHLSVAHSLSVFTIYYLPEFFIWCLKEELPKPWINVITNPIYYQVGVFPEHSKQIIKNKLQLYTVEISKYINLMFNDDVKQHLDEFWAHTNKIDQYRSENFAETFPELCNLLKNE